MATAFALNHIVVVTSSPPGLTAVLVTLRALPALLMTRLLGARESQKPTTPLRALKGRWQRAAGWVREGMVTGLAPLLDRRPTCPHSPRWVTPRAQAPPRRTPPEVVFQNLWRILRRELSTLAARRFQSTSSAATVSIFQNLLPQGTKLHLRRVSCAGNGLMGGVNE
jgi:hypothetical protein